MAVTIYEKTEKMPTSSKLSITGWLIIDSTINQPIVHQQMRTANRNIHYSTKASGYTRLYCHIEAPTEPTGDGLITTTDFDSYGSQTDTEYSGNGFFKYFTSETGIFTYDQDFSKIETQWIIYYVSKYANVTSGYSPYIQFHFYKRNSSNVDTELFSVEGSSLSFYLGNGQSASAFASGSVTTSDRLRIGIYGSERLPS